MGISLDVKRKVGVLDLLFGLLITFSVMLDCVPIFGHVQGLYRVLIVFAMIGLFVLPRKKVQAPPAVITLLFAYAFAVSLIASFHWGLNKLFFNYGFCYVVLTIFVSLGSEYTEDRWMQILQKIWILLVLCTVVNDIVQWQRIEEYFAFSLKHPIIQTLVGGGVNLEATWIAVFVLSFFKSKWRVAPLLISIGYSLLYASRAGLIADFVIAGIFAYDYFVQGKGFSLKKNQMLILASVFVCAMAAVVYLTVKGSYIFQVIERFGNLFSDPGSRGRLAMWKYAPATIVKYPFGVGLGNVMPALETISPLKYTENNLHNIYMQMFIELGIFGGVFHLLVVLYWLRANLKRFFTSPIVAMLYIYFLLALLQFRGGDTLLFCLLGIYLTTHCSAKHSAPKEI